MGSGFYTFQEAAKRLNRSTRSLHDYVKKGFLKKRMEDGQAVLDREDVDLMAVDMGVDAPSMNRKSFLQMQTLLEKTVNEVRALKHALGLRDVPPLRPPQVVCEGLISACTTYLHIDKREDVWTTVIIEKWSDLFERMDEETFNAFSKTSNDPQAWVPFFKFCSELADFCWEQDKKLPSLVWQARASRLETARQRLRGVVVTWLEMGRGVIPAELITALGSNREALLGRIAKG
jgi:hypothetical protein